MGGKTDLILGLAKNCHYNALLLRRSYNEIKRGFMKRSKQFYGDEKYFTSSGAFIWNLPGQTIEFGYGERADDYRRYKGPNFDLIAIDEASETPRFEDGSTPVDMMMPWNRTVRPGQRVRMVLTSNPGGPGEEWLIEYFGPWLDPKHPNPAKHGELRWFTRNRRGNIIDVPEGTPKSKSRTFIASGWKDNPYTDDDEYEAGLYLLPEPMRSQLLRGIFGVASSDDRWQVIPSQWVRDAQARWTHRDDLDLDSIGVDVAHGGKDKTVFSGKKGNWFAELKKYKGTETSTGQITVALLREFLENIGTPSIGLDIHGIGVAAYDIAQETLDISGYSSSGASERKDKTGQLGFFNLRAESYWMFREALDPDSGMNLALPPDQELLADLCTPRWQLKSGGKVQLESKRDIIRRIGRSPNTADAIVICWHEGNSASVKDFYPEDHRKPMMHNAMTEQF